MPPPTVDERKVGLILRDGTFTSSSKRAASITSKTTLHAINQPHRYLFLDGTCLKDVSVRENLQGTFCLAFIPEDGVVPCWAELKPILSLNPSLLSVLDYVESTRVFNDIYPIHMWNVYKAVIDGGLRNNKFPEGQNHALQLTAGCSHPGIELLIEIPTLYNTGEELDIQQTLSGTVLVPHRKTKYANFDLRYHLIVTITVT